MNSGLCWPTPDGVSRSGGDDWAPKAGAVHGSNNTAPPRVAHPHFDLLITSVLHVLFPLQFIVSWQLLLLSFDLQLKHFREEPARDQEGL